MSKKLLFFVLTVFCLNVCYADTQTPDITENTEDFDVTLPESAEAIFADYEKTTHSISDNNNNEQAFDYKKYLSQIIDNCSNEANRTTKNIFNDFDQDQYNDENTEYKVNNARTRMWHNKFLNTFDDYKNHLENQVKAKIITLEEHARITVEIKRHAKTFTRNHVDDIERLETVKNKDLKKYGNSDGPTFEWLLNRQLEKQKEAFETKHIGKTFDAKPIANGGNFDIDDAYRSIIKLSTKTNSYVNVLMRCYDYLPTNACDLSGSLLAKFMDI